jgi:hypothetical protein
LANNKRGKVLVIIVFGKDTPVLSYLNPSSPHACNSVEVNANYISELAFASVGGVEEVVGVGAIGLE